MADEYEELELHVTVVGTEDVLASFVQLCKTMDMLGWAGASRTIQCHYDGDGNARLAFEFGETNVDDIVVEESVMDEDEIHIGFGN